MASSSHDFDSQSVPGPRLAQLFLIDGSGDADYCSAVAA